MKSKNLSLFALALAGLIFQVGVVTGEEEGSPLTLPLEFFDPFAPNGNSKPIPEAPLPLVGNPTQSPPDLELVDDDGDGLTNEYEIGHGRYFAIEGKFDWEGANESAKKRGGHIATITSEAEWKAVKEVLGTIPHGYYLGGTDEQTEGIWEWITGETWKFTKWAKGEPNNLPRPQYGDEDFAQTWTATADGNRLWNDIYGQENPWSKGYILEYGYYTDPTKADSDGDGINDRLEVIAGTDPNNPLSRSNPEKNAPNYFPVKAPDLFQEKFAQFEEEAAILRQNLEESEESIGQLQEKLTSREKRIAVLEKQLDEKDSRIAYLDSEVIQRRHSQQKAEEETEELVRITSVPFVNGWCYLPEQGWLWTDANTYPYFYRSDTKSWCYYQQGTLPRLFFDDTNKQWEAWDIEQEPVSE